jgi:hypothetical protein
MPDKKIETEKTVARPAPNAGAMTALVRLLARQAARQCLAKQEIDSGSGISS